VIKLQTSLMLSFMFEILIEILSLISSLLFFDVNKAEDLEFLGNRPITSFAETSSQGFYHCDFEWLIKRY
jgi:hypothetical protein